MIYTPVKDLSNRDHVGPHHDTSSPVCSIQEADVRNIIASAQSNLTQILDILACRGYTSQHQVVQNIHATLKSLNQL